MRGEAAISRYMAGKILKEFARLAQIRAGHIAGQLTPRQKEVLRKISEGLSNKEIALQLCIGQKTVEGHVTNILRKLHLQTRTQAAAYARRWGLLDAYDKSVASEYVTDGIIGDIKELRDLERLEAYNKSTVLGHAMDRIVHDLRGGLGVIRNTAGFALDDVDRDNPLATDLRKIVQSAEFCEVVIRNLMALGGGGAFELTKVNIERVFREVFFMLERKLVDVTLVVDADPYTPTIMADEGQMKQVFMNLIRNAGEAMPDGGTLTLRTRHDGQVIRVEISDTGSGISPENQERLFQEFFTTKDRGYGLGLHIVNTIVKRHGGTIAVESKVGEGTTFTLHLPIESD
jgi:signal transduction histidine kinase